MESASKIGLTDGESKTTVSVKTMMANPTDAIAHSFLVHFLHHITARSLRFAIEELVMIP
uniref:Uncharacterized protein MANES_09G091100 n=1 Tax=Rhizophora mucronata TaxID=61149 RepID=A0A2P2IHI4_RHIMU